MPDAFQTEPVQEMEAWLAGVLRGADSSLLDEWEKLRDPNYQPDEETEKPAEVPDITRNKREFTALIRTENLPFSTVLSVENYAGASTTVAGGWTADKLAGIMESFYTDHERIRLDNEARNERHTYVEPSSDSRSWRVCQVIIDPEELNDWQAEFTVDLALARGGKPTLVLTGVDRVAPSHRVEPCYAKFSRCQQQRQAQPRAHDASPPV